MPRLTLGHLTKEQHQQAAQLLRDAQANLADVARIVKRAGYIDRYLDVAGAVQEVLINPLQDAWDEAHDCDASPYSGAVYLGPRTVRRKLERQRAAAEAVERRERSGAL